MILWEATYKSLSSPIGPAGGSGLCTGWAVAAPRVERFFSKKTWAALWASQGAGSKGGGRVCECSVVGGHSRITVKDSPHRHRRVAVAAFRRSDGVGMEYIEREQRRSRGSRLRMLLYPLLIGVCLWRSKTLSQPLDYNIFLLHPNVSQRPTLPLKLNKTCWENGLAYMFSGPQYPARSKWSPLAFIFEGLNFFRVFVLLKFHFFNNLNDCEIKSTYLLILLLFLMILMVAL